MTLHASKKMRDEYRNLLRNYRLEENKSPVANRHPYHAQIAVSELMELAISKLTTSSRRSSSNEALIITGSAPDRVFFPETADSFDRFFKAGGRVRLVVWNDTFKCGDRLRALFDKHVGQVEWRVSQTQDFASEVAHFLLVCDQAYRLESPHEPFINVPFDNDFTPEIPAKICFNDPEGGASLRSYFEEVWELLSEAKA